MNTHAMYRGKIFLDPIKNGIIDYNYNQSVAGLIYSALSSYNSRYKNLHDEGFLIEGKKFKLFNFTLEFKDAYFKKDGIHVTSKSTVILIISGMHSIVQSIAKAILNLNSIWIFNTELKVNELKKDNTKKFQNTMLYHTYSGVIESYREVIDGRNKIYYTSPTDSIFFKQLAFNLKRKYQLIYDKEYEGPLYFDIEDIFSIRKKKIKIKENCVKPSWVMDFWLQANPDMQKVAYYLGIGQQTSFGFGCLKAITGRNEVI